MNKLLIVALVMGGLLVSCTQPEVNHEKKEVYEVEQIGNDFSYNKKEGVHVIYLAGGCFWGIEKLVQSIPGVIEGTSGYANGIGNNPTYKEVVQGKTEYRETVRVEYNPEEVSLESILYAYFSVVDPTVENRQGNDVGTQYQTGVYYADEESMDIVKRVVNVEKERVKSFKVEVKPLVSFYDAEEYHQNYLDKNPQGYCHISQDDFNRVKEMKVDPSKYQKPNAESISENLSEIQYKVTQEAATEKPFNNEFDSFFEEGIYVDVVTGEPLFTSLDKYNSECGWPAFTKTVDENTVIEKLDQSLGMARTEVVSRVGNSHLGHKFSNDLSSPNGVRYCINSAALRFIPKESLEKEGYTDYLDLFDEK